MVRFVCVIFLDELAEKVGKYEEEIKACQSNTLLGIRNKMLETNENLADKLAGTKEDLSLSDEKNMDLERKNRTGSLWHYS